jgi:RHS repeat-associated protein
MPAYNVYFGGKLVLSKGVVVVTDRLGSVRSSGGAPSEQISYFPYGEERTTTADNREKFGTYMRDNPGQDYADQRYYAVGMGRFMTPDPSGSAAARDELPVSWNLFGYAHGDPINRYDPRGRSADCPADDPCSDEDQDMPILGPNYFGPQRPNPPQTKKVTSAEQGAWMGQGFAKLKTFTTTAKDCLSDLSTVGLKPEDIAATATKDRLVNIYNVPPQARKNFDAGADFTAVSDFNAIYYNASAFWQQNSSEMQGTLLHELIHMANPSLSDTDIQIDLLGKSGVSDDTRNISRKLAADCFK